MRRFAPAIIAMYLGLHGGCGRDKGLYVTDERKAEGLVVILPGIEGESALNHDIRDGLLTGGTPGALVIRSWGMPIPGVGALVNQTNVPGNRLSGAGVARMIVEYKTIHPDAPVYIVGHSGGGGIAVFAAEALADMDGNHSVDGIILLSASISGDYDLAKAISHSRRGLVNFFNPDDAALLGLGTTILGNVDGGRSASAGRVGFRKDFPRLYQVEVGPGVSGGEAHASTTRVPFVAAFVAPWLRGQAWPAVAAGRNTAPDSRADARGRARSTATRHASTMSAPASRPATETPLAPPDSAHMPASAASKS
jgi:pimeloyl-ACP methyl ester carboxylesterase